MHLRTTQECSFATVYHSLYATVAYPDMKRWHKVYDTPLQVAAAAAAAAAAAEARAEEEEARAAAPAQIGSTA